MIFHFDRALVREPAPTVVAGLSSQSGPPPSFEAIRREHSSYCAALGECGLSVETLAPLETFPDSIFVEDPALVCADTAIILRPGAPTRQGEADHLAQALRHRFDRVLRLHSGFVDGGDLLLTPHGMLIGLSSRTDQAGALELAALLQQLAIASRIVATPAGTLHLKSDCALIDDQVVLCTAPLGESSIFKGYRTIVVPPGEERAANALRLNDTILIGHDFPRTIDLLNAAGYAVRPLSVSEIGKLDAGLSCMSLRWKSGRSQGLAS